MTRILYVGDPHIKPNNLKESEALMGFVMSKAIELKADRIEILGDLWDTHALVRLEVTEFWDRWFKSFSAITLFKTIVLVGNHDLTGDYSNTYSALHPFLSLENKNFKIVHEPYLDGVYGYLPYIHDNQKFIEEANKLADQGATVLVSHPNFEGAVYDNGSDDLLGGVADSSLSDHYLHLIGGHIHTELELGRIWYTGNPRWLTKSCANKKKGIWLVEHSDTGQILSKEFISTESACTPIVSVKWIEGQEKPEIPKGAKVDVELQGSSDWVTKTKKDLIGVSVSSKITDTKKSRERKSGKSLYEFLSKFYETDKREKLLSYMRGLDLV